MMAWVRRMVGATLALAVPVAVLWTGTAAAQEYVLGPEDVIQISVWLHPELERTVTVTRFMSRSVLISGAVAKLGRSGFERLPGLIDVLSQAGGVLPGAELSLAQILRKEGEARRATWESVERFSNVERRHSALGYVSPIEYELVVQAKRPAA